MFRRSIQEGGSNQLFRDHKDRRQGAINMMKIVKFPIKPQLVGVASWRRGCSGWSRLEKSGQQSLQYVAEEGQERQQEEDTREVLQGRQEEQ